MPRDDAMIFGDLIGKLDTLTVACEKCHRSGRYAVRRLVRERGRSGKIIEWLAELTAACPRKIKGSMSDQCAARCPELPKVL